MSDEDERDRANGLSGPVSDYLAHLGIRLGRVGGFVFPPQSKE